MFIIFVGSFLIRAEAGEASMIFLDLLETSDMLI